MNVSWYFLIRDQQIVASNEPGLQILRLILRAKRTIVPGAAGSSPDYDKVLLALIFMCLRHYFSAAIFFLS